MTTAQSPPVSEAEVDAALDKWLATYGQTLPNRMQHALAAAAKVRALNRDALLALVKALDGRADGYEARGDTIYNGSIIAEELRHWCTALQAVAKSGEAK